MDTFKREERYIVIKLKDMGRATTAVRSLFSKACRLLHDTMLSNGAPARSFLVIESDWPEYEPTWAAIERRMTGKPAPEPQVNAELLEALEDLVREVKDYFGEDDFTLPAAQAAIAKAKAVRS